MEGAGILILMFLSFCFPSHDCLIVNVRANVDESVSAYYRQDILGNSSSETVLIQYSLADGSLISQLTDFRMSSQIVRILIPGEEELDQPMYQGLCFVSSYGGDLIPPEAVMKLRQKHPATLRIAEQDNGEIVQDSSLSLKRSPARLAALSTHLSQFCPPTQGNHILSSHHELFSILEKSNGPKISEVSQKNVENYELLPRCFSSKDPNLTCICSLRICFNWFPCALKYCSNKEGEGEHRCGIKTCRKCMTYRYPVRSKNLCHWDEI
ncbi:out at first protein [Lepeophtheirus salmonis]|uniref:OAF homolog (Drosophila) [Ceratitis capitata] n=1 Tax=Lepeophtheirus salmonis TaxID=72036 RepID=A0A0K2TE31_LEPSM|nr:out at first protein-like [Lepeophtheirus salmonis]